MGVSEQELCMKLMAEQKEEEELWGQKFRNMWPKTPDLNTRFFHISTISRRRQNAIDSIKNDFGQWLHGRDEIGSHIEAYFKRLFTASRAPLPYHLGDFIPKLISEAENEPLVVSLMSERSGQLFVVWEARRPRGRMDLRHFSTNNIGRSSSRR